MLLNLISKSAMLTFTFLLTARKRISFSMKVYDFLNDLQDLSKACFHHSDKSVNSYAYSIEQNSIRQ